MADFPAYTCGRWQVECRPEDGGRLHRLRYAGRDLLTPPPEAFRAPAADHGMYETRPVYGYDDCFPTVDAGPYPGRNWTAPDHGELCRLPWAVVARPDYLSCAAVCRMLPLTFSRHLTFGVDTLDWTFRVRNLGRERLPFLHVMHALMPAGEVVGLALPACATLYDEMADVELPVCAPETLARELLDAPAGGARMLLLRGVRCGGLTLTFRDGLRCTISWSRETLPTLGIWWNRRGYPREAGLERDECAFEPMAGPCSSLARSHAAGQTQWAEPQSVTEWTIRWRMTAGGVANYPENPVQPSEC